MNLFLRRPLMLAVAGLTATAAIPSGIVLFSTAASAQEEVAFAIEEMVITARKREETLSTTPAAVTALSEKTLEQAGIESIADVAMQTPGLTFYKGNAGGLSAPTIRGIAATTTTTFDNNVGVFLDGVFISAKANLDLGMFNLQRVEVIKGPQSALYGNNTFSGAINYVTKAPGEELEGKVSATVGTGNRYDISATVSAPIVQDKLAARVSAGYSHFGGTIKNTLDDENLGGWDYKRTFSADVLFTPNDAFTARLFYYNNKSDLDGSANIMYANNCGGTTTGVGRSGTNFRYYCGNLEGSDSVNVSPYSFVTTKSQIAYANLAYEFDNNIALRSITSWGKYDSDALSDQKLNIASSIETRNYTTPYLGPLEEWSQELRVESFGNDVIDWSFGGYYYDRSATLLAKSGTGPKFTTVSNLQINDESSKMSALFGSAQWQVSDDFRVNGELRYTEDKKEGVFTSGPTSTAPVAVVNRFDNKYTYWTYRATADYKLTDTAMLYGTIGSGTKSGGFNNTNILSEQNFGPEKNTTFELGYKDRFFGGRLGINVAAFYIDWTDIQISTPSAQNNTRNIITNLGSATAKGFEIEFSSEPVDNWKLNGGFSFTDPKWKDGSIDYSMARSCSNLAACDAVSGPRVNGGIDVSGRTIPKASKYQFNLNSTYTWNHDDFDIYVRGDLTYRSKALTIYASGNQWVPSMTFVNARVGVEMDKVDVSLWVNNLFNQYDVLSGWVEPEFVPSGTYTTGILENGRTIGITANYKF